MGYQGNSPKRQNILVGQSLGSSASGNYGYSFHLIFADGKYTYFSENL
jgi:hypothetical protein